MNEINRKINITKPRRSATYEVEAPSGSKYRAVINKTAIVLHRMGVSSTTSYASQKVTIPESDLETVIDLLTEAQVEHTEQVKLEGDAA